jgi:outer membrane protein OmpA-like peptidoglycan-associated protein
MQRRRAGSEQAYRIQILQNGIKSMMKKLCLIALFFSLCVQHKAQVTPPDTLKMRNLEYKNSSKMIVQYDFTKAEKKAFLFFDIQTEPMAEVMYNGCKFVFDKTPITIFPVYFTGQLIKKASADFPTAIPTQLYESPDKSPFKDFRLADTTLPFLVVYSEKNEICGFARNTEQISEIDCGIEIKSFKRLMLKIMTEEKDKSLKPYSHKPIYLLGLKNNDTIAKLVTNQYGDFETQIPDLEKDYLIVVNEKIKNINFVILSTQTGKKIGNFKSTDRGFEYRLLKTELKFLPAIYEEDEDLEMKFIKEKSKTPDDFVITENLFYELGESNVSPSSRELLDKMKKVLEMHKEFQLLVISHTDSQGDEARNLKLSLKRSESVVNYLISKGIDPQRLKAEGKGETEIRNRCFNNVDCSDKEHEYNRRTEFKFTKK